jgi:hypothetical protein
MSGYYMNESNVTILHGIATSAGTSFKVTSQIKASRACDAAGQFYRTATHALEAGDTSAAVTCIAFSLELGLKSIQYSEGNAPRGHTLSRLLVGLSSSSQGAIKDQLTMPASEPCRIDLSSALEPFDAAFIDWRYAYEKVTVSVNYSLLSKMANATLHVAAKLLQQSKKTSGED